MRLFLKILALIVIFSVLCPSGSAKAEKWMLADENDKGIRKMLEPYLPVAQEQLERFDSDVVLIFDQRQFDVDSEDYTEYENRVWWIRRGEAEDLTNYVRDFPPGVKIDEVKAFRIRAGSIDSRAALKAEIEELGVDRIHVQKGDDSSRATNLVVAFDAAEPGDILGISIKKRVHEPLRWRTWFLAGPYPVARAELRLKTEWYLAYTVFGHRLSKGRMKKEILDEKDGHIKDLRLCVDEIDPVLSEPYAPPPWRQSPSFAIVWRAKRLRVDERNWVWWYTRHWNQVAGAMAVAQDHAMSSTRMVAASGAARNLDGEEAAAENYRFVRDQLLDVSASIYMDEAPTVDDVLEYRAGDLQEKSYLLVALLASHGMQAEILWAHDPDEGTFFAQYPSWGQVNVPLVRLEYEGRELWYDLGCGVCVPGEIRPGLRGVSVLRHRDDVAQLNAELVDRALEFAYAKRRDIFSVYLDMIENVQWCDWVTTPYNKSGDDGFVSITRSVADTTGTVADIVIESTGWTQLRRDAHSSKNTAEAAEEWAWSNYDNLRDLIIEDASDANADTLRVSIVTECTRLPEPIGDIWVLPAEFVYGTPVVKEWPEERASLFFIGKDMTQRWELRVPLPEAWEYVLVPGDQVLGVDVLEYRVNYEVAGGELVVTREFLERKCLIDDEESLRVIGEEARAMHELETSPVVLRRQVGVN